MLLKLLHKNVQKFTFYYRLYCNAVHIPNATEISEKKLDHYRHINDLNLSRTNLEEWSKAKPFESIPGPKPLPFFGNTWRFYLPKIGDFFGLDFLDVHKLLHKQCGDIAILKGILGRKPLILLFNPNDIEKLHRNEGVWPIRRGFPAFRRYRQIRKNVLPKNGLSSLDGEDWFKFRTIINPIMMQPKNIAQYTDALNGVADQLIDNIRYFSRKNCQMPEDFEHEMYKFTFESVGTVLMDGNFGCLKLNSQNSEPQKLVHSILEIFDLMYKLDFRPGFWKIISTPTWRSFVKNCDYVLETILKHVDIRLEQLEQQKDDTTVATIVKQLAQKNKDVAKAWAVELILSGVDTTAKVLAAALYFLSKNPEVQLKLRSEAMQLLEEKETPITKEIMSKAVYTKAVIKEALRLAPVTVGVVRFTTKNLVLGGYQIPTGIHVQTSNLQLCQKDEYFPKAKEFFPDRWMMTRDDPMSSKKTNPFVFAPFGYGPRSCAAKRLAHLELEIAVLKIVRNFELSWPHEDMVFETHFLHGIARPLTIHVKEV